METKDCHYIRLYHFGHMFQQYTFLPAEDNYTEAFLIDVRTKKNWNRMKELLRKWIVNKSPSGGGPFPTNMPAYDLGTNPENLLFTLTERLYATLETNGRFYNVIDEDICKDVKDVRTPSFIDTLNVFFEDVCPLGRCGPTAK